MKAKFSTWNSESQRWYINPHCFASLLASMLDLNIDYLGFNGFSNIEGLSTGGSKSHISGKAGDLRYLSKNRNGETTYLQHSHFDYEKQVAFNNALYKYGWSRDGQRYMLSENFMYNGKITLLPNTKHFAQGNVRHYHHLHLQGFNFSTLKIVNK